MKIKTIFISLINIIQHESNYKQPFKTILRIIWWKLNQLFFNFPIIYSLTDEIKCICYPKSSYASLIIYSKYPEYIETLFLKKYLKTNSVFFDVGSGFGDYSLIASSVIKHGKIYSFEPIQEEINRLKENVKLNNIEEVVSVFQMAVSNYNGTVNFNLSSVNEMSYITAEHADLRVKCTKIDTFCKKNNIEFIDFLKIDVEGEENNVILGALNLLKKQKVGAMIIEFNVRQKKLTGNGKQLILLLKSLGYVTIKLNDNKIHYINNYDFKKTENFFVILNNKINMKKVVGIFNDLGYY
jgi:FkbM family methyltransferase